MLTLLRIGRWLFAALVTMHASMATASTAEQTPNDPLQETLNEPAEFQFAGTPLADALQALQKKYKLALEIDEQLLQGEQLRIKSPVTFHAARISLGQALRRMLADAGLGMLAIEGRVIITTREIADNYSDSRLYPVLDLAPRTEEAEELELHQPYKESSDVLRKMVDPASWVVRLDRLEDFHVGPRQDKPALVPHVPRAGLLVIPQRPENHRQIATLLALLRRVRDQQFASGKLKLLAQRSFEPAKMPDDLSPELRRALGNKIDLDLKDVPLRKAIELIADKAAVPIYLDRRTLAEAKVSINQPLSLQIKDVSLQTGLNLLLHPHNLGWKIDDQLLLIATKNVASEPKTIRVYPVADLVEPSLQDDWDHSPQARAQILSRLFNVVDQNSMCDENKDFAYLHSARALVVLQTDERHDKLQSLLTALREARTKQFPTSKAAVDSKRLVVRVYRSPAAYLRNPNRGGFGSETEPISPQLYPADELVRIVPQVIDPTTWKGAGSTGTIHALADRIVVQQTEQVHQQIVKLFRSLQARE